VNIIFSLLLDGLILYITIIVFYYYVIFILYLVLHSILNKGLHSSLFLFFVTDTIAAVAVAVAVATALMTIESNQI
jgi:hypothetical protein